MEALSNLFYEIMAVIMSFLLSVGGIVTPPTDDLIENKKDNVLVDFVLAADPQVCNYNPSREANLVAFSQDILNSELELDAFILAGDIAENGFQSEFDRIFTNISEFNTKNFIIAAGNHDIRLREYEQSRDRILTFMNDLNKGNNPQTSLYYKYDVEGYTFLVIGSDKSEFETNYISDAQLQWLNLELKAATAEGKPVFVICHQPLAEGHGLPLTWGSTDNKPEGTDCPDYVYKENVDDYDMTGCVGDQTNEVYDIITSYENVFFITGHLHTGFGKFTYQTIDADNNVQGVNLPSVGIDNKDGQYNNPGTGLYVEVTDSQVIFYARDFSNGKFLSETEFAHAEMAFDIQ